MTLIRSKNIIQKPLTLKQSYEYYTKDLENDSKYNVDYKIYRSLCETFNKEISKLIIDKGYFFKMPYRLGTIRLKKRKIDLKNLKPDFGLFNKSDEEFKNKHLNEHSNNYYVRFYWNKVKATIVKNKTCYCFIPTRFNKRYCASVIKEFGIEQINKYFD